MSEQFLDRGDIDTKFAVVALSKFLEHLFFAFGPQKERGGDERCDGGAGIGASAKALNEEAAVAEEGEKEAKAFRLLDRVAQVRAQGLPLGFGEVRVSRDLKAFPE
jgi:hypothetical protein